MLAVVNAATLGPVGSVTYQFDIAANPHFNPVLINGTVDQQQPQTMFAVPSDLVTGTTYFWRARALASAVAGPYSATQSFATINPASPGLAALQLYFNASCRTFFGEREFTVYGHLTVSGANWRFTVPPNAPGALPVYDLVMDLAQSAGRLSGTIRGWSIDPVGFPIEIRDVSGVVDVPAPATGALGANSGAAGTFTGIFTVGHPSFGIGGGCSGVDIPWVLTPSR